MAVAAIALAMPNVAAAQTVVTSGSGSESTSNSDSTAVAGSESAAVNAGNAQSTNVTFEGATIPRDRYQAPNAIAPSFGAAGINVCAGGGASLGVSFPGGAVAGGAGREDGGCDLARLIQSMRLGGTPIERAGAAVANCLNDERAGEAFQALGYTCAQVGQEIMNELGVSTPASLQTSTPTEEMMSSPSTQVATESRGDELRARYIETQGPSL